MRSARNLGIAGVALLAAVVVSVAQGEMGWFWPWEALGNRPDDGKILLELRWPRAPCWACSRGPSLGVAGALMQGFFRNPVAEPYVTGVSSGAAFGAVAVQVAGLPDWWVSHAAFAGASAVAVVVWRLATRDGETSPLVLLLAGMAMAGFLQAATMGLLLRADPFGLRSVLIWLMGSLAYRGWEHVAIAAAGLVPGLAVALAASRVLDLLAVGEESAAALGVPVETVKRVVIGVACLMAGTAVAACGIIAYVGLMAPHLARMLAGGRHRSVLPGAALLGALLLTVSDLLSRQLLPGQELPVGVITGVLGAVFLAAFLLGRRRYE